MAYADDSIRLTLEFGGGDINWFLQRDLQTRAKMATLIRRDWPASEALTASLRETYVDWHSHLKQSAPSTPTLRRQLPPRLMEEDSGDEPVRKRARKGAQAAGPGSAEKGPRTVSVFKGNARACKAWNDGRGLQDRLRL